MLPYTKSYLSFKVESERLINLVVLFSHAVPVLIRVASSPTASALVPLKPADAFEHSSCTVCANNGRFGQGDFSNSLAIRKKLVDVTGFEPATPCLQSRTIAHNGSLRFH